MIGKFEKRGHQTYQQQLLKNFIKGGYKNDSRTNADQEPRIPQFTALVDEIKIS